MRWLALAAALTGTHWFHSPSGNIQCEVASTYTYCQTFKPLQTAELRRTGHTAVCSHRICPVGNGPENATTLGYGRSIDVGPFRCTSATSGIRCLVVATGHGFMIARAGVKTF
jgi:hypothetical protein